MATFVTYRSFNDKVLATELFNRLNAAGIPVAWESSEGFFDASFANNEILNYYYVRLRKEDFPKADHILWQLAGEYEEPAKDYYLFSFSDQELADVLKKPGEWNEYDRYWAQQILEQKGITPAKEEIVQERTEQLAELKKPWILDKTWILGGIALLAMTFYFLHILWAGGAFFLGLYISFGKKTLPDGTRVMAFSPGDRLFGKIILAASILLILFIFFWLTGFNDFRWFF